MKAIRKLRNRRQLKLLSRTNPQIVATIKKVTELNLSYLDTGALCDLAQLAMHNEKTNLNGVVIEAGCALGGSAITLATAKNNSRPMFVYDVFSMIPAPSDKDGTDVHARYEIIESGKSSGIGGNLYYGYEKDLYTKVLNNFATFGLDLKTHNITLVKGLFQDTLKINDPVSMAHIDCDWYDSVMTCLKQITPHLVSGGTLVVDDYYNWSGCGRAVQNYFNTKNNNDYIFTKKSVLHIIKR